MKDKKVFQAYQRLLDGHNDGNSCNTWLGQSERSENMYTRDKDSM